MNSISGKSIHFGAWSISKDSDKGIDVILNGVKREFSTEAFFELLLQEKYISLRRNFLDDYKNIE